VEWMAPPLEWEGAIREPVKSPKQRQRGEEADHELRTRRHEGPWKSSLFEMESMESSLRSKDKLSLKCCQAIGREVRIVHRRESLYPARSETPGRRFEKKMPVRYNARKAQSVISCAAVPYTSSPGDVWKCSSQVSANASQD
jgi:hypothetical protein